MAEDTAGGRLRQIRQDWEVALDVPTAAAQAELLPKVEAWLAEGEDNPERVIRAAQILACPDHADSAKRPCILSLGALGDVALESLQTGRKRRNNAQALILAAWGEGMSAGWFRIAPMLLSAWETQLLRDREGKHFADWQRRVHHASLASDDEDASTPAATPVLPSLTLPNVSIPQVAWDHIIANTATAWTSFAQYGPQLVDIIKGLRTGLEALPPAGQKWTAQANSTLKHWADQVEEVAKEASAAGRERELLWWGQARYSHTQNKPLRRISNPDDLLQTAAREVADRSIDLPVEPVVAYFVEVLHALDESPTAGAESRTLAKWCETLRASLGPDLDVDPKLAALVQQDATALPITWVRDRLSRNLAISGFDAATGLSSKMAIDRDHWASWVLRELMIDREFKNAE